MTLRDIVKEEVINPQTVKVQLDKLAAGVADFQKQHQLNAQNMEDVTIAQQLGLKADQISKLSAGLNNTFQQLVKQNIAMKQQQQNASQAQVNQNTANGTQPQVPTANKTI